MILVNAFIIYQSCLPEISSKSWSDTVVEIIGSITNSGVSSEDPITPTLSFGKLIRKIFGHFSLFMIDGVFTYLYFYYLSVDKKFKNKYTHLIPSLSVGIVLAVGTELLQLVIPGRVGDGVDIAIDIAGYLVGVAVTYLIVLLVNRKQNQKALA